MSYEDALRTWALRLLAESGYDRAEIVDVTLSMEEGQYYSTLTGSDPPYIALTVTWQEPGRRSASFTREFGDIGEVVRALVETPGGDE